MFKNACLIISSFLLTTYLYAGSLQIGFGGITPHFSGEKKNYCNQWNNSGVIVNKTYYLSLYGERWGATVMTGNDSICSQINGGFIHYLFEKYEYWDYGITFGGYAFNYENWQEHARKTPQGITAPGPVHTKIFGQDVVPVLALSVGLYFIRRSNWALKMNNLFTPIIFNHSIAFEFFF